MATYGYGNRGFERVPSGGAIVPYVAPATRAAGGAGFKNALSAIAKGPGLRTTAVLAGIPIALDAIGQLGQEDSLPANVGGAVGSAGGGIGGAILGGALGSPLGPWGIAAGAALGGTLGSQGLGAAGRQTAGWVYDKMQGTPEDRATRQAIKNNEAMFASQLGMATQALPVQRAQMQLAADIERQRLNDAAYLMARNAYSQALLGSAAPPVGAYADPQFSAALASAGSSFL